MPALMQVNYAIEYIAELLQLGELQVALTWPATCQPIYVLAV